MTSTDRTLVTFVSGGHLLFQLNVLYSGLFSYIFNIENKNMYFIFVRYISTLQSPSHEKKPISLFHLLFYIFYVLNQVLVIPVIQYPPFKTIFFIKNISFPWQPMSFRLFVHISHMYTLRYKFRNELYSGP